MSTYGVKETIAILEEIVAEAGAEHMAKCVYAYVDNEGVNVTPVCIVGHFVYRIGGEGALLELQEGQNVRDNTSVLNSLNVSGDALPVLVVAQNVQDAGDTWGRALELAKEKAGV